MDERQHQQIVSFLFSIANDCLVHECEPADYKKYILPFIVLRRFDAVLEPTKQKVLETKKLYEDKGYTPKMIDPLLCNAASEAFYNISQYVLKDMRSFTSAKTLEQAFTAYRRGFSKNVQEILEKFMLEDEDATINPVPVQTDVFIHVPDMDTLTNIITTFMQLVGNIDWKDEDRIRRQILEIPNIVAADAAFQNAMRNSDEQNSRIESDRAAETAVTGMMNSAAELCQVIFENEAFRNQLFGWIFNETYRKPTGADGDKK